MSSAQGQCAEERTPSSPSAALAELLNAYDAPDPSVSALLRAISRIKLGDIQPALPPGVREIGVLHSMTVPAGPTGAQTMRVDQIFKCLPEKRCTARNWENWLSDLSARGFGVDEAGHWREREGVIAHGVSGAKTALDIRANLSDRLTRNAMALGRGDEDAFHRENSRDPIEAAISNAFDLAALLRIGHSPAAARAAVQSAPAQWRGTDVVSIIAPLSRLGVLDILARCGPDLPPPGAWSPELAVSITRTLSYVGGSDPREAETLLVSAANLSQFAPDAAGPFWLQHLPSRPGSNPLVRIVREALAKKFPVGWEFTPRYDHSFNLIRFVVSREASRPRPRIKASALR